MLKFIGMYFLMGIIALFGPAIYMSFSLLKLSNGDDDVYFKSLDIITQMLSGESKHGWQRCFINLILNIATFPCAVLIMLSRYPEAKEYVIANRNAKPRES